MKRKINKVKKEYQVYMHKVHVLCWLGHGNYVSGVLNDQELMAAVLSLVPSKECYPGERVDMKYVEQITTWYKDKLTLKQDKNEDKFKPKAPPLKMILLEQIKKRVVTTKKYLVFIFVTMLRALGLQCRVMFNFVTLPIKPPSSELCSLSTKPKEEKADGATDKPKSPTNKKEVKAGPSKPKAKKQKIAQVDGNDDSVFYSDDDENIMQVDGSDDNNARKTRSVKRAKANENNTEKSENEDVSPPKIAKKKTGGASPKATTKKVENKIVDSTKPAVKRKNEKETKIGKDNENKTETALNLKEPIKSLIRGQKLKAENSNNKIESTEELPTKTCIQKLKPEIKNLSEIKDTTPTKSLTRGQKTKAESGNNLPQAKTSNANADTNTKGRAQRSNRGILNVNTHKTISVPKIAVTDENAEDVASKYFKETKPAAKSNRLSRKRSQTANPDCLQITSNEEDKGKVVKVNARTKSVPGTAVEKSKYFNAPSKETTPKRSVRQIKKEIKAEDSQRVSHRDLAAKAKKGKGDVTEDLVQIIKSRVKDAKLEAKKGVVKGKLFCFVL